MQSDGLTNVTPKRYLAHYIWLDKLLLFGVYSHGKLIHQDRHEASQVLALCSAPSDTRGGIERVIQS